MKVAAALAGTGPTLIVGQAALAADPSLKEALAKVAKPNPVLRADAIVVKRAGNRVYLIGNNDDSHYYAVTELLNRWGCRWYMPTEFGECIPRHRSLSVGELNYAYGPGFEARRYWLSWIGDTTGKPEFMHRNFFNEVAVPSGHHLAAYTSELIPPGKSMFNVPISEDKTAQHVAKQLIENFKKGEQITLGLEDGIYESESALDKELNALQYDKYFLTQSYTDAFMTFYNKVSDILLKEAPNSQSKIGFLIYSNITLPPVKPTVAAKPLIGYLAPIDFDPIHGMDDPRSKPRREYKELVPLTDGTKGTLVAKTPLVWNFRRDPKNVGATEAWQKQPVDLAWWNSLKQPVSAEERNKNPGTWEQLRTDVYAQAQGVVSADFDSYTGHGWYQTELELDAPQTQEAVHLKFPGLFNECWLYVNGEEVAHREFKGVWWMNDYRFEWDVDLAGKLKPGKNSVVLRINNPHHFGGIFRRPFLYKATGQ